MIKLIDLIAGARPNFMKIAPIIDAIKTKQQQGASIRYRLIHTGQHYDQNMSSSFFEQLGIPDPDMNLGAGGGTQAEQTAAIMIGYENVLQQERADICLVVGDVTSTMACSIVARKMLVDVAHVEAGIRSGDWTMPEEINRIVTDSLTNYFFTTSEFANANLRKNGVAEARIFFVGNTMIDSLLSNMNRFQEPEIWSRVGLERGAYIVMTLHRPANVDEEGKLKELLEMIIVSSKGLPLVFPVHPRTAKILKNMGISASNLHMIEPLGYLEFNYLVKHKEGSTAIKIGRRGRQYGDQRIFSPEQEKEIQRCLIDRTPDQLKLSFALWTREAVKLLIKQRYGISMPIRTVGEYLKRWGFTPQKPVRRAYEQNTEAVNRWLDIQYPEITALAKKEKAEIHWGDETGIQTDAYRVRGFAPKGNAPVIKLPAQKSSINMISSITNQGKMRFMMYRGTMNCHLLIKFMSRLVKDSGRKVFLILDNLRSHHGIIVKEWLAAHKEETEVFYLPYYSPELNPDEYLNGDLKQGVHSGLPVRNQKELEHKTKSFM